MADTPAGFHTYQSPAMGGREGNNASASGSGSPQTPGPGPTKPTYSKRGKITIVACVPCRKRKTKCDGKRPICSQCHSRDAGQCQYDMNEEQRKLTHLRINVDTLEELKNSLEAVLWHLCNSTEGESLEILRRIRGGADPHALVQQIQAGRSLTQVKGDNTSGTSLGPSRAAYAQLINNIATSSPSESDKIVQRLRRHEPVDSILSNSTHEGVSSRAADTIDQLASISEHMHPVYHARPMSENSLAPALYPTPALGRRESSTGPDGLRWTQVTEDREFIDHLLDVYFMWQHAFFQNFPEELFRQDYQSGNSKYCSRVLLNAICAAGCLLSDRPEARGDQNDPTTAGAGFFEEGMRLLNHSDRSSIPTIAGVFILSHVEGYRARLGAMWGLVGRSARMAIDLGLHLRNEKSTIEKMNGEELKYERCRIHAFWGCFVSDQITSLSLGRLPQLMTNAVTVELPPHNPGEDERPWGPLGHASRHRPGVSALTFRQCAMLSKIVNSTLLMFFAPSQIIKGRLLLEEYHKYQAWYKSLPVVISSTEHAPAHVLVLHMYYHAAVLLLFRPFLRAKFTESDLVPSELCRQSAVAISKMFEQHLALYNTTGLYTFQLQCLLAACTIHLVNLPAISSTTALHNAINSFHLLVSKNTWALGSLKLIKDLVVRWNIILPGDVEATLYRPHPEVPNSLREHLEDPAAPQADPVHGTKRAAFLNPSSQVLQKRQKLAPVKGSGSDKSPSFSGSGSGSSDREQQVSTGAELTGKNGDDQRTNHNRFLFSPFPNQPAPLLGPIHTSTSVDEAWADALTCVANDFDGLRFDGDGWFMPY